MAWEPFACYNYSSRTVVTVQKEQGGHLGSPPF